MPIGKYINQPEGYKAFIAEAFPDKSLLSFSNDIIVKVST